MSENHRRRSRLDSSDENEEPTRPSTPISTAPGDAKRLRVMSAAEANILGRIRPQDRTPNSNRPHADNGTSTRRKHQPGAIVRVKLVNFVTYTAAEFFPGPNLNMVIGPNGTGKSTLVCAICLGLGWSPNLLGRARDVAEFVKHGTKEAIIEIELQRAEDGATKTSRNPIIRRRILKDDTKSAYWIDGRAVPHKSVQELMSTYNIQVDNLCQFLPQDRVVEFAQMTPIEMLETTLRAAAHPDVLEQHADLKARRVELQNFMYNSKGDRDNLANLEKRQATQHIEVERFKEREIIKKSLAEHELCMMYAQYSDLKKTVNIVKRERDRLRTEVARLEEDAAPTLARLTQKQSYADQAKQNWEIKSVEAKRAEDECKRLKREITTFEETISEQKNQMAAEKNASKTDKQSLTKYHKALGSLKTQKDAKPHDFDTRAANEKLDQHRRKIRELKSEFQEIDIELARIVRVGKETQAKRNALKAERENLTTYEGQQEDRLRNISSDTHKAWKWIQGNQDKFEQPIIGPPAVTCTITDQSLAASFETLFQPGEAKVIICQSQNDYHSLRRHLANELRISDYSLRTITPVDVANANLTKPLSQEQLESFGLQYWAIDCIKGPPAAVLALGQSSSLNRIGISLQGISNEQHALIAASSAMSGYVAGQKSFRFTRRAEYGDAGTAARAQPVREARIWTDKPTQSNRATELADQIKVLAVNINTNVNEVKAVGQRRNAVMTDLQQEQSDHEDLEQEKKTYQENMSLWNGLPTKIVEMEKRINDLTEKRAGMNDRVAVLLEKADQAMFAKADAILKLVAAARVLKDAISNLIQAEVINIEAQSDHRQLRDTHKTLTETLAEKGTLRDRATIECQQKINEGRTLATTCRTTMKEAEKAAESGDNDLLDLIQQTSADPDISVASFNEKIDTLRSRLDMVAGGLADSNTIVEFEERARQIERLTTKLETFDQQQERQIEEIKQLRTEFEGQLQPIIRQIDQAFGDSFARIGCAGQVAVYKASSENPEDCTEVMGGVDNGLDFAHWAIHISVKFRDNEPLSLLDSHRQSGGERAVSTIFYLMALQSLSKSPFRVVDEINQGMDQRNERMVHGRMVDIAAAMERRVAAGEASGSQYFLITPKLLSGLKYERGMTVLCIVSGENMPSATDTRVRTQNGGERIEKAKRVDFKLLAQRARELGYPGGANNANSGQGIGRVVSIGA